MAKAVSTFISIGLLVAAERAGVYWQRNHRPDEFQFSQMRADAGAYATNPQFIRTNFMSETNSTYLDLQP